MAKLIARTRRTTFRSRDLRRLDACLRDLGADTREALAHTSSLQDQLRALAETVLRTAALVERIKGRADAE
jgi:hypothetical protein